MGALQLSCQVLANIATTGKDDAAHRIVYGPEFFHHCGNITICREEEHGIVFLDNGAAFGQDQFTMTINSCQACI